MKETRLGNRKGELTNISFFMKKHSIKQVLEMNQTS